MALGRANWLFAGTLAAGKRAAVITSLIQSAKLNGHNPYTYLKDVLQRLPTPAARQRDRPTTPASLGTLGLRAAMLRCGASQHVLAGRLLLCEAAIP